MPRALSSDTLSSGFCDLGFGLLGFPSLRDHRSAGAEQKKTVVRLFFFGFLGGFLKGFG